MQSVGRCALRRSVRHSPPLQNSLVSSFRFLHVFPIRYARRDSYTISQTEARMKRAALIEAKQQNNNNMNSDKESALQHLEAQVEEIRKNFNMHHNNNKNSIPQNNNNNIVSLTHFLSECKTHKVSFGVVDTSNNNENEPNHKKDKMTERNRKRKEFVQFWNENIENAVYCCFFLESNDDTNNKQRYNFKSRDFSFIAAHGLSDHRLQCPLAAIQKSISLLTIHPPNNNNNNNNNINNENENKNENDAEARTMSSRDTFVVLQYISRELKRIDRELHQNNHHNKMEYASYDIEKCKIGLANLTLQRITFFFTATNQNNNNNTKDRDPHGAFLGSAEDALAALETLLNINVESYADPNQWELFLKHSNNHNNQNVTEENEKTRMLVAHLMTCIMQHKVELRFTSLVQAFSLTRIYLSILYPYPQRVQQKSLLLRWSWSLARALYVRDKYFVNSYHFVKIINALARFPAYTLAPSRVGTNPHYHNKNKNENNGVEEEIREFQRSMQQREHEEMHSNNTNTNNNGITAEEFWDFLVSKAIIFILQNRQDETFIRNICVPLYICIEERRGQFFNHHENEKVSEQILKPLALECGTLYDMILIEYKKQKSNKSTGGGGRGRGRGNRPARQYGNRPQRHYPHHNNRNDRRNKK